MAKQSNSPIQSRPDPSQARGETSYPQVPMGATHDWNGEREVVLVSSLRGSSRAGSKHPHDEVEVRTVRELLDRYHRDVIPTKAITTQESNAFAIVQLKSGLGDLVISQVTAQSVAEYFTQRRYKVAARREIEVLSHAYTKAVEWGFIDRHPFKGELRLPKEEPKNRYVEDWEVLEMLSLKPRQKAGSVRAIQSFIRLMLLTGLRRVEILRVKLTSIQDYGFEVEVGKSGNRVTFPWTEELRTAVYLAKNSRPIEISAWLFCKADGTGYFNEKNGRADGWDSMWGRFVDRTLLETKIVKRFSEHDLRARAGAGLQRRPHRSIAAFVRARATVTTHREHSQHLDTLCVRKEGRQFMPISPKYLAQAPVAEFIPASNAFPIHQKKRKVQLRLARPAWADRKLIMALYAEARARTRNSGSLHVVDHIVPLHHALVCGLHVPANMRVVPERINAEKHNRFDPSEHELLVVDSASNAEGLTQWWTRPEAPSKDRST